MQCCEAVEVTVGSPGTETGGGGGVAKGGGSIIQVGCFGFSCFMGGDLDPGQTIPLSESLKGSRSLVNTITFALASVSGSPSMFLAAFLLPLKADFWQCWV